MAVAPANRRVNHRADFGALATLPFPVTVTRVFGTILVRLPALLISEARVDAHTLVIDTYAGCRCEAGVRVGLPVTPADRGVNHRANLRAHLADPFAVTVADRLGTVLIGSPALFIGEARIDALAPVIDVHAIYGSHAIVGVGIPVATAYRVPQRVADFGAIHAMAFAVAVADLFGTILPGGSTLLVRGARVDALAQIIDVH